MLNVYHKNDYFFYVLSVTYAKKKDLFNNYYSVQQKPDLPGLENWFPCNNDMTLCCILSCAACRCSSLRSLCCSWTLLNLSASCLWAAKVDSSNLVSSITSLIFLLIASPFGRPVISSPSIPIPNIKKIYIYSNSLLNKWIQNLFELR